MQLDMWLLQQRLKESKQKAPVEAIAVPHHGPAGGEVDGQGREAGSQAGAAGLVALHQAGHGLAGANKLGLGAGGENGCHALMWLVLLWDFGFVCTCAQDMLSCVLGMAVQA